MTRSLFGNLPPLGQLLETDRLLRQFAAQEGKPLPEVKPGPELAALVERIQQEFGATVLLAPHTFNRPGVYAATDVEAGLMTAVWLPDFPETETARLLLRGAGHLAVAPDFAGQNQDDLGVYFEVERQSARQAGELACEWGMGHLYPPEQQAEDESITNAVADVVQALARVAGLEQAWLVMRLLRWLELEPPPALQEVVKGLPETYPRLADLLWQSPELAIGLDRCRLYLATSTNYGSEPLIVIGEGEARQRLARVMGTVHSVWPGNIIEHHATAVWLEGGGDEPPTYLVIFDHDRVGSLAAFIDVVQYVLLTCRPDYARLLWRVTQTPEIAVYEAEIEPDENAGRPTWRIIFQFGPRRPGSRADRDEQALRVYLNSYQAMCGLAERTAAEYLQHLAWLIGKARGPLTAEHLRRWDAAQKAAQEPPRTVTDRLIGELYDLVGGGEAGVRDKLQQLGYLGEDTSGFYPVLREPLPQTVDDIERELQQRLSGSQVSG